MSRQDLMTDKEVLIEKAAVLLHKSRGYLEQAGEIKLAYEVAILQIVAEDKVSERVLPGP